MTRSEYISEILRMEGKITMAVLNGHKPHTEDIFKEDRIKLKEYREKIGI